MSIQTAKAFHDKAVADKDLQTRVRAISTGDHSSQRKIAMLHAAAEEAGFTFTEQDLLDYIRSEMERQHAAPNAISNVAADPHTCFFSDCGDTRTLCDC